LDSSMSCSALQSQGGDFWGGRPQFLITFTPFSAVIYRFSNLYFSFCRYHPWWIKMFISMEPQVSLSPTKNWPSTALVMATAEQRATTVWPQTSLSVLLVSWLTGTVDRPDQLDSPTQISPISLSVDHATSIIRSPATDALKSSELFKLFF